jgi:hypothetical protein
VTHSTTLARFFGVTAVSALLVGSALLPASARVVILQPQSRVFQPQNRVFHGGCPSHGAVRVTPCLIVFTATNPGPETVNVKVPSGSGTLVEADTCASAGIATITQNPSNPTQFVVAAGPNAGKCFAHFRYFNTQGKKVGHATAKIINML